MKRHLFLLHVLSAMALGHTPLRSDTPLSLESIPAIKMSLAGPVGERVAANVERWILEAPRANPGMLEMFRVRDREPVPQLVPWAGEFVGKYLISAVQAMRMSSDPRLEPMVKGVIDDLLTCQAEDGYLGPFRKQERLLGAWDLWGHYHIMHALLMWHERTNDERALAACRRIADLVCKTYLNAPRRVFDAGSHEMNMAILTSLGWLYRTTREDRYLAMMKEVLADFERAGDYYRAGLDDVPFYQTPRPRWESLHCLQGLVEMYRITGETPFQRSYLNTWQSIRQWDERNTGGFSSGEQATGNPYEDTPIETCCTIAWSALSLDALKLTARGDVVDALERSFFNGVIGAQHPTGRWWTYNTPMNGIREASAHTIVFQSRAGTPELNCCSVNAPRGLGMLSEWGVMKGKEGIFVHYLGPMTARIPLEGNHSLQIKTRTSYPLDGELAFEFETDSPSPVSIFVRVPGWAKEARLTSGGKDQVRTSEEYFQVICPSNAKHSATLTLAMPIRYVVGDMEQIGKVSLYRGPLLLTYDQSLNSFDPQAIPPIDLSKLPEARTNTLPHPDSSPARFTPWLVVDLASAGGAVRLCDFASAGSMGNPYRSWLTAQSVEPPTPILLEPKRSATIPPGRMVVAWRRAGNADSLRFDLRVIDPKEPSKEIFAYQDLPGPRFIVPEESTRKLQPLVEYSIDISAKYVSGNASRDPVTKHLFHVDPSLAPLSEDQLSEFGEREDGTLIEAPLKESALPTFGSLDQAEGVSFDAESVVVKGEASHLTYKVRRFPDDYTLLVRVRFEELPAKLAQIASAWCKGGDDPLRLCIDGGQIFARVEGMGGASTSGQPIPVGRWVILAVVKDGTSLRLWMDGKEASNTSVPRKLMSGSQAIGLGRNPRYGGDESLTARFRDFHFYARALANDELKEYFSATSK
ncbi:glycoside hydrolase family 127 protein [bacterium]|nr:glycoside hydrolase family 127 protein [bacterium]